jgi:hypothetical protein
MRRCRSGPKYSPAVKMLVMNLPPAESALSNVWMGTGMRSSRSGAMDLPAESDANANELCDEGTSCAWDVITMIVSAIM